MQRFSFTSQEIDAHKSTVLDWGVFVRSREFEIVFSLFPNRKFSLALELGAGTGLQSLFLARHCERLICTELEGNYLSQICQVAESNDIHNVEYRQCDAQDLAEFADGQFDLIYSSNLLEHIPDLSRCLAECKRVLRDDGLMLHTMPSRWWKLFNWFLSLVKLHRPAIHGVSDNHLAEFAAFGYQGWITKFRANGFSVEETAGLPFYVGHCNSFIPIIKAGNRLGLHASFLYVAQKQ